MKTKNLLLLPAFLLAFSATAQMDPVDIETQRCLATRSIKSRVVIGDSNILFFMKGDSVYHNRLPEVCKGLLRYKTFSYEQIAGRICEADLINVHRSNDRTIVRRCRIGIFEEIDSRDIPELIASLHRPPAAEDLPSADVEEVGEDEDEKPPEG